MSLIKNVINYKQKKKKKTKKNSFGELKLKLGI